MISILTYDGMVKYICGAIHSLIELYENPNPVQLPTIFILYSAYK